jgi:hypothetical protein
MSTILLIGHYEVESVYIKAAGLILPFFILEPVLIALTGGTIGQHIKGIKVQSYTSGKNLNILLASIRFVIKALTGWWSFILVLTTKRHQALHDVISMSTVVNKTSDKLPATEALPERTFQEEGYLHPSRKLRASMILVYSFFSSIALAALLNLLISRECLEFNLCKTIERTTASVLSILWFFTIGLIIVLCWHGRLVGCRRKRSDP